MKVIKKIEEKIHDTIKVKSFDYRMGIRDCLEIALSELEKEVDRKKCENCKDNKDCPKRIYDDNSGNVYYLTYCSNFDDMGIK